MATPTARAQSQTGTDTRDPWIVTVSHWGRWPALAGAAGLITAAAFRNSDAKTAMGELRAFCGDNPEGCVIIENPDGSGNIYLDPEAEVLYQEYASLSRKARGFLIGGQVSLIVAGTMFLVDLVHDPDESEKIPYTPFELYSTPTKIGLALRF
jgi:hypothetical protein